MLQSVAGLCQSAAPWSGKKASTKTLPSKWKQQVLLAGLDSNYDRSVLLAATLNTNGYSGGLIYLWKTSAGTYSSWLLNFSEIRAEKQKKIESNNNSYAALGNASPYVFGKINNLYTLDLGYGKERVLLPGIIDGNVSVLFRYRFGASLALLKPYYLKLVYGTGAAAEVHTESYSLQNRDYFLDGGSILGAAPWEKGLASVKYIPGIFSEISFACKPSSNKAFIQKMILGARGAFYAEKWRIMADERAVNWQASLFIGLELGKQWLKK